MASSLGYLDGSTKVATRSMDNPLDVCTVVSIFPESITERKHTIQPGHFHIEAGSLDSPAILVIKPSSWWRELNEGEPLLEIGQSSIIVASSFVKDWKVGLLGVELGESSPGLFFVTGEKTSGQILKEYPDELEQARLGQKLFYENIVRMADQLWARSNGDPLSISSLQKLAAQELKLKEKPWLKDFNTLELVECPACGTLRNNSFPICTTCHTIVNPTQYAEMKLASVPDVQMPVKGK